MRSKERDIEHAYTICIEVIYEGLLEHLVFDVFHTTLDELYVRLRISKCELGATWCNECRRHRFVVPPENLIDCPDSRCFELVQQVGQFRILHAGDRLKPGRKALKVQKDWRSLAFTSLHIELTQVRLKISAGLDFLQLAPGLYAQYILTDRGHWPKERVVCPPAYDS